MPQPENWEELKQTLTLPERRETMKKSFVIGDEVVIWDNGVELNGKIVAIKDEDATVETKWCILIRPLDQLFYS